MEGEYQEYPYRFAIILLFFLPSFINGMCWVVVSPISTKISECYDVSDTLVTLIPMLYMIMYLFVNFPSNWILDSKGIRKGVIIGAVMTALGAGIRCMVNLSFTFVIVGQIFCAIGQPFILNAPAKIATFWFKEQNVFIDVSAASRSYSCPVSDQYRGLRVGIRATFTRCRRKLNRHSKDANPSARAHGNRIRVELYRSTASCGAVPIETSEAAQPGRLDTQNSVQIIAEGYEKEP